MHIFMLKHPFSRPSVRDVRVECHLCTPVTDLGQRWVLQNWGACAIQLHQWAGAGYNSVEGSGHSATVAIFCQQSLLSSGGHGMKNINFQPKMWKMHKTKGYDYISILYNKCHVETQQNRCWWMEEDAVRWMLASVLIPGYQPSSIRRVN